MSASSQSLPAVSAKALPRRIPQIAIRAALVAVAVLVCYRLEWRWLKFLTSELNLRLDWLAGLPLHRVSFDTVVWRGVLYKYEIACTLADVWCGSIPLLWDLRRTWTRNLAHLAVFSVALLAFNVLRLTASDIMYSRGLPWTWAHEVVGGAVWFAVWVYLCKRASW